MPRLGRDRRRADGFRLVAAMNPFDAVGTARVSQAIADRMCRIAIGYQDEQHEREIVQRQTGLGGRLVAIAVAVARGSRAHPAARMGSSVRGAIDMVRLGCRACGSCAANPTPSAGSCSTLRSPRCPVASASRRTRAARPRR